MKLVPLDLKFFDLSRKILFRTVALVSALFFLNSSLELN
jgi:hypothetical protein